MEHEIIVEGFVLQVEVTHCENTPAQPNSWASDWDFYGSRELEFKILSAVTYDANGTRHKVPKWGLQPIAHQHGRQIETALWIEIDARKRRERWIA
jgi:hypothetical protein